MSRIFMSRIFMSPIFLSRIFMSYFFLPLIFGAAFSCLVFSCHAVRCRIFMSRIFISRIFSVPTVSCSSRKSAKSADLRSCLARRRPHYVSMLSVCPSVCPVPPPRGKTKRPTNTKLGRKGPRDTSTPWTNFKVKRSKVKVTEHSSCVNVSLIIRISRC